MNRFLLFGVAVLIGMGGFFFWPSDTRTNLPNLGMAEAQESDAEVDKSLVKELTLGDPNAPLTVIEYASFTCPHCKNFHKDTFKQFKEAYVDTGKVHFIYREVYFDRFGLWAGMVARCGGGDRYFPIADMIYDQQATWTKGDNPGAVADNLAKIARTAGLTSDEIDACLQDGDLARAMIAVFQEHSERDGIRSTPSFMIDGELTTGNMSFEALSEILDGKLDG